MNHSVLHLTHTDIRSDSRILKEMISLDSLCSKYGYMLYGIGLESNENSKISDSARHLNLIVCPNALIRPFKKIRLIYHFLQLVMLLIFSLRIILKIKPKIIHCHDTLVLPIALIAKIIYKSTLIYDAHELESNRNSQGYISSIITKFIEKIAWKNITLFITVSPSISEWYINNFGYKENITILNSPLLNQDSEVKNSKFNLRKKLNIQNDKKIYVYLGIFGQGRGIENILEVFANFNIDAHLLFVGWGPLKNEIQRFVNLYKNIHLHEPVDHINVVPLVKECDFGVCMLESISLSDHLCLPNKLFEYCFANVPVLASNLPELSRIIKKHDLGEICANNVNDIAKKILHMNSIESKYSFRNIDVLSWQNQTRILNKKYIKLLSNI